MKWCLGLCSCSILGNECFRIRWAPSNIWTLDIQHKSDKGETNNSTGHFHDKWDCKCLIYKASYQPSFIPDYTASIQKHALHHTDQIQGAQCPCQCIHREQTARQSSPYSACNPHSGPWFPGFADESFPTIRWATKARESSESFPRIFVVNVSAAAGRVIQCFFSEFICCAPILSYQYVVMHRIIQCVFSSTWYIFCKIPGHNAFPSRIAKEYWHVFFKNQGASKTKASHWSQYGWTSPAAAWRLGSRSL